MSSDEGSFAPTGISHASDRPREGSRFASRYLVLRLLGRGGMGSVFAVADTELGEEVALKVLDAHSSSGDAVERFRREVRLARRITHKNVARIFDIGEHGGTHYLTMELVAGESLADLLARGERLAAARACTIAAEVARGLAAAHATGVVHRDLKPGNVLMDKSGRAVITDFGIACALSGEVRLTVDAGAWMGTPAYMSPEQLRGDALDGRSDVYALGVMLFELLTGKLPFSGDGALQIALARLTRAPIDPRTLVALDDPLADLVLACLAVDPAARPPDAASLAEQLAALAGATTIATTPSATMQTRNAPRTTSGSPTYVATAVGDRSVAVLPFRYRGPADEEYLAEALTDELIDLLSMTRGLRVTARGATAKFTGNVDPRAVGKELGVDAVVEGVIQRAGENIRISAKLVTVETGFQTWSDRFDGKLADVFELQDRLAKRVAEGLRAELQTDTFRAGASPEAIEFYLRARKAMRTFTLGGDGPDGAVGLLERCLALAPDFRPAIAAQAVATERMWFIPSNTGDASRREAAEAAIARALAEAPQLAESHLAAARLSMQRADYGVAARELATALSIAPTFAIAHEALGGLQCEAARAAEGLRHLQLAAELDPTCAPSLVYEVRFHELKGDHDAADRALEQLQRRCGGWEVGLVGMDARIGAWRGDRERVIRARDRSVRIDGAARFFDMLFAGYLGQIPPPQLDQLITMALHGNLSPRFRSLISQIGAEGMAVAGADELASAMIQRAVDDALVDIDWLERCPVLAGVRARPEYAKQRERVRARAEAIWILE
ncbi:MAG TPA: serine/threonine-protein kinase [Nannocystaceae bacterium]|nr:serine/threonine-protein kinase [Nannocystaceae bacterium]